MKENAFIVSEKDIFTTKQIENHIRLYKGLEDLIIKTRTFKEIKLTKLVKDKEFIDPGICDGNIVLFDHYNKDFKKGVRHGLKPSENWKVIAEIYKDKRDGLFKYLEEYMDFNIIFNNNKEGLVVARGNGLTFDLFYKIINGEMVLTNRKEIMDKLYTSYDLFPTNKVYRESEFTNFNLVEDNPRYTLTRRR